MKFTAYGSEHKPLVLLLHGGGLSWWNYREIAQLLSPRFHVILPILDGHAESTEDFSTIEDNAERIISFIDEHFNGQIFLLGGLSLGAQIAAEMLSRRPNLCQYAVLESPSLIPSKYLSPFFSPVCAPLYRLVQYKWFAKWQFRYLRIQSKLFDEYYRSTCGISVDNLLSFLKASVLYALKSSIAQTSAKMLILYGEREQSIIRRSAQLLHNALPQSILKVQKNLYHGEFSLNHPTEYVQEILSWIEQ